MFFGEDGVDMEENSKTNETLVNLIRLGTDRAENLLQLWKQNKAFIATLARKYSGGAEMEDLEQEGFIGLCEAIPHVFNTETEAERLQNRLITLDINFPESILMIPEFKGDILKIVAACGEELTELEKDLGADYQKIVTMQMRVAMGLQN